MTREFDDATQEPKDYTKHVWAAVGLVVLAMVIYMVISGQRTPTRSEVSTSHILIRYSAGDPADRARALELIHDLRERIVSGEDSFEKLAEQYSDDPQSGPRGGYVGTHARGDMEDAYDEYSWTAPVGELSPVIQTGFGYHLVIVHDRYIAPGDAYDEELERRIREQGYREEDGAGAQP